VAGVAGGYGIEVGVFEHLRGLVRTGQSNTTGAATPSKGAGLHLNGGNTLRTRIRKRQPLPSESQAARAIYVDFEGFKDKPPSLVGILVDGQLRQVVLEPQLYPAAVAKDCETGSIEAVARELRARCQAEGRVLIGFSTHELEAFKRHAGENFDDVYRNALVIARRWWHVFHPGEVRPRTLKSYLKAIGHEMPAFLGVGKATSRLKSVIGSLSRRGKYKALPKGIKNKWYKLLDYNKHDCKGTQMLVILAARELATRSRPVSPR
jgi:hypothetical protein